MDALPLPCCLDDQLSRAKHNTESLRDLGDQLASVRAEVLQKAEDRVTKYKKSVDAVVAADKFCGTASAALHDLRSTIERTRAVDYAACLTVDRNHDPLQTVSSLHRKMSITIGTANELQFVGVDVSKQLRQSGTYPNMRKRVHNLTLSLVAVSRDAAKLLGIDGRRFKAMQDLISWKQSVCETLHMASAVAQIQRASLSPYSPLPEEHALTETDDPRLDAAEAATQSVLQRGQLLQQSIAETFEPHHGPSLISACQVEQKRLKEALETAKKLREMRASVTLQASSIKSFLASADTLKHMLRDWLPVAGMISDAEYVTMLRTLTAFRQSSCSNVAFSARTESNPPNVLGIGERYLFNSRILALDCDLRRLDNMRIMAPSKFELSARFLALHEEAARLLEQVDNAASQSCDDAVFTQLVTRLATMSSNVPGVAEVAETVEFSASRSDVVMRLTSIGERLQALRQRSTRPAGYRYNTITILTDNQDCSAHSISTSRYQPAERMANAKYVSLGETPCENVATDTVASERETTGKFLGGLEDTHSESSACHSHG